MTPRAARAAAIAIVVTLLSAMDRAAARAVPSAALVKAGKAATVAAIDPRRASCEDDRTVEEWLEDTVGASARSIRWSGRRCKLANKQTPRDAGTPWCAQADIAPKKGGPPATVEVYFEAPKGRVPGKAFAFRASVRTKQGWDLMRDTFAFAANWSETYVAGYKPPDNECD